MVRAKGGGACHRAGHYRVLQQGGWRSMEVYWVLKSIEGLGCNVRNGGRGGGGGGEIQVQENTGAVPQMFVYRQFQDGSTIFKIHQFGPASASLAVRHFHNLPRHAWTLLSRGRTLTNVPSQRGVRTTKIAMVLRDQGLMERLG